MPIQPVKIPQNVYVEDRIIGPITLKQLIILGLGAGISYILYASVAQTTQMSVPLAVILWSPALVAAGFAFLKVNDLSLFQIILLFVEHLNKPATRTWCPHPGISINFITRSDEKDETPNKRQDDQSHKLMELTKQLEAQQAILGKLMTNQSTTDLTIPSKPTSAKDSDAATEPSEPSNPTLIPNPNPSPEESNESSSSKPVDPTKVEVSHPSPIQSIDGLSDLGAFKSVFDSMKP